MRVLWIVNVPLPEASILMNKEPLASGGWLINASEFLAQKEEVKLSIAFPQKGIKHFTQLKGKKINYYPFKPVRENDARAINNNIILKKLIEEVSPDIVHVYGTELAHTLSIVNACKDEKIKLVISIQGLVSIIQKHMFADLPWKVVYGATLRNILRRDNVIGLKKIFYKRGKKEIEAIKKVNHVIGRTTWDRACTSQINSNLKYYFCNETLREEFYRHQWDIEKCERYSIFLSQAHYPIKGFHYVIEALPLILNRFPETKVYISGKDITKNDTLKDKLLMTFYGKYMKKLIRHYNLEDKIIFTGPLGEKEMCERYLKSNVFVCPSSIENSPNSLGEAMVLGVPCVASDVGGVSDMLRHKKEGFVYQADAPYMLAHYVNEIFENDELALRYSNNARAHALETHDPIINTKRLMDIYEDILQKKDS